MHGGHNIVFVWLLCVFWIANMSIKRCDITLLPTLPLLTLVSTHGVSSSPTPPPSLPSPTVKKHTVAPLGARRLSESSTTSSLGSGRPPPQVHTASLVLTSNFSFTGAGLHLGGNGEHPPPPCQNLPPPPSPELVNTAWGVRARLVMLPQAFQLSTFVIFLNEPLLVGTKWKHSARLRASYM